MSSVTKPPPLQSYLFHTVFSKPMQSHLHTLQPFPYYLSSKPIYCKLYHEYEIEIEKPFPRITIWHHEACPVMTSCDPNETIKIYHECEGRIEKSAPRIAVWHHEACLVMTNGDPEERIFLSYPHRNYGFFFLLTTVFIYLF